MKVLLIAIGSRGDVQPFAMIDQRLAAAGVEVHVAASDGFASMVKAAGLVHHALPADFQEMMSDPAMKEALTSFRGKMRAYRGAGDMMNGQLSAIWEIGLALGPDLILYHFKRAVAPYLARKLGVPAWPVMLQPGWAPTKDYPQFMVTNRQLGGFGNMATHRVIGGLICFGTRMMIKKWVKTSGVEIGPRLDIMAGYAPSGPALRLHAYSEHIQPLGTDMPTSERQVGYAFAAPEGYSPPPELADFLSAGETPIYAGFGSMPNVNHARVNTALKGTLAQTGLRAVVALAGWRAAAMCMCWRRCRTHGCFRAWRRWFTMAAPARPMRGCAGGGQA